MGEVGEWKRRGRVDPRSKTHKVGPGRPRTRFLWVDDPVERRRLIDRASEENPQRVVRAWRHEPMRRSKSAILAEGAALAYAEWFDSLDDHDSDRMLTAGI